MNKKAEPKKTGRPTKYSPSFIAKVDVYLKRQQDKHYEFHKTRGLNSDTYEQRLIVRLPTREGFARFVNVHRDSINEWERQNPAFSDALKRIDEEQKHRLLEKGLSGDYNPVIAKLILSSNHDMREKTDTTSDGKAIGSVDQVIAAIEAARR